MSKRVREKCAKHVLFSVFYIPKGQLPQELTEIDDNRT